MPKFCAVVDKQPKMSARGMMPWTSEVTGATYATIQQAIRYEGALHGRRPVDPAVAHARYESARLAHAEARIAASDMAQFAFALAPSLVSRL